MAKLKPLAALEKQVAEWNENNPPGTEVFYHPVIGVNWNVRRTKTTTFASILGGHTATCFVEDVRGCVALDALEVA